jgi:anti-sigma factor RsiW
MGRITRLTAEQRENLVAYLDGELDESQAEEVEQGLKDSVVARHDVEMLSRTWDLLNFLPGVKASEEFSRKTLSTVQTSPGPAVSRIGDVLSRNGRRAALLSAWAAVLLVCGLVAYQATHRWVPDPNAELLDDFDIVENLDDYQEVGNIEFLKALNASHTLEHNEPASK